MPGKPNIPRIRLAARTILFISKRCRSNCIHWAIAETLSQLLLLQLDIGEMLLKIPPQYCQTPQIFYDATLAENSEFDQLRTG